MYLATLLSTAAILYLPLLLEAGIVQSRGLCLAEPPAEFVKAASKLYTTKNHPSQQAAAVLSPLTNLAVKVYMHVVSTSTALSGGNIPDSQITAQFNRLRDSFCECSLYQSTLAVDTRIDSNERVRLKAPNTLDVQ